MPDSSNLKYLQGEGLSKEERLSRKLLIDELFLKGRGFRYKYLRIGWCLTKNLQEVPAQVMFSVPKRFFKRANKRNFLKRRMKEVYRRNKLPLYYLVHKSEKKLIISISYQTKEILSYSALSEDLQQAMHLLLLKIKDKV